jgi:hypothetical protein
MYTVHERIKLILTAGILAVTVSCSDASSLTSNFMSVENSLKRIQTERNVPPDLTITYDDMHGLWGGTTIVITGKGSGERRERDSGSPDVQLFNKSITREQILELVKLLIEHEAWKQRTPDRDPLPDESRASLKIQVDGQSSNIWEWFNDMEKTRRLSEIKARMNQLTR